MQQTNLNVNPFFDDYDPSKNFHRILFKPRKVQVRELNQLQSILQEQISRVGAHLFEDGSMVIPGGISVLNDQDSVGLTLDGGALYTDITTAMASNTLYLKSKVTGLKAKIQKTLNAEGAQPVCFFVDYQNSGDDNATKKFTVAESCAVVYNAADGTEITVANVTTTIVSKGSWVKVLAGVYFVRGFLVNNATQEYVVNRFATTDTIKVGFQVTESIVSETDDNSLYSNAVGEPNFKAPGAARLKITLTLTGRSITDNASDFIELARLVDGVLQSQIDSSTYSILERTLAQRTYEESGDYTVDAFPVNIREHLRVGNNDGLYDSAHGGDSSKFVAQVKPGLAYVKGYRVQNIGLKNVVVNKARDTRNVNNGAVAAEFGNYIVVQNIYSMPVMDIAFRYQMRDASDAQIGTCAIRGIRREGSTTYRLYIFDQRFNAGKSMTDFKKVYYSDASNLFKADLVSSVLYNASTSTMLFKLPYDAVKTLKPGGIADTTYSVIRSFTTTTNASGQASINLSATELFGAVNNFEYFIGYAGAANPGTTVDATGVVTLGGSPVGRSLTLNLGATHANKSLIVIAPVIKQSPSEKTKTLTTRTQPAVVFTAQAKVNLDKADVVDIVQIIDNGSGLDVTTQYVVGSGQTDNWYDFGTLSTADGSAVTKNLSVTYRYFEHSTGDYATVDSYGGLSRETIPTYVMGGAPVSLADVVDFRPIRGATAFTSKEIIKPGDNIRFDASFYLPRTDILYVDETGEFGTVSGVSTEVPVAPPTPANAMALYQLVIPAYTSDVQQIKMVYLENKRYTMRDIGKLEDRLANVEYYTSLSLLENKTATQQVIDPVTGNNRFKNGFAVDDFTDFSLGNPDDPEWGASLDVDTGLLNPQLQPAAADMSFLSGTNYAGSAEYYMLPYTEVAVIDQPLKSRTININPYAVISWVGAVRLTPESDFWKDVYYLPPYVVNVDVNITEQVLRQRHFGNWWVPGHRGIGETDVYVNTSVATSYSDNAVSQAVIPYMRSIEIRFDLYGFKPFTRLYSFFDGVGVTGWCRPYSGNYGDPLVTDASGYLAGFFLVPNTPSLKFLTGTKVMRFTDDAADGRNPNTNLTYGEASFASGGISEARQVTVTNVRTTVTRLETWYDPIAQTFMVNEAGGALLTGVDIYFATKSQTIPVRLQIRTVENGVPTNEVISGGEKILNPASVGVSSNGSVATRFQFDNPVYVEQGREYAIVMLADTVEYNVFIAEMGQNIIGQNAAIARQPYAGVFLTSANASTWSPNQLQDLSFKLYRAQFNPAQTAVVEFASKVPSARPMEYNAITTTNGSSILNVKLKSHGLKSGDKATIAGFAAGNNILAADVNKQVTVATVVDLDHFTINVTTNANTTGTLGGSGMTIVGNNPFVEVLANINQFVLPTGTIKWEYSYLEQASRSRTPYVPFDPSQAFALATEAVNLQASDLRFRATLNTTVPNLSPVVDTLAMTAVLKSKRVNNDTNNAVFQYVTDPIKFDNPSTSAKFYIAARLPSASTMKLFYKLMLSTDEDLSAKAWVELSPTKPIVNDNLAVKEYEYSLSGVGSFVGYKVKIQCLSSDPAAVPQLQDFRSIALA